MGKVNAPASGVERKDEPIDKRVGPKRIVIA
jgi:hypothetical protein